ncbi:MAG: AmmeMemoRadiSam system protein A [Candidatus Shapirobacteria bacterium]
MNIINKKWLLGLARKTIEGELRGEKLVVGRVPVEFKKKKACFITLTKNGELRGCIGHLISIQELYRDVIENAKAAAFVDYRFSPVTGDELPQIKIEISILDRSKKYKYPCPEKLVNYLAKNKPGVILKRGFNQVTYLPQVWEELKNPEKFMNFLCQKAGLPFDEWRKMKEVGVYKVEKIT